MNPTPPRARTKAWLVLAVGCTVLSLSACGSDSDTESARTERIGNRTPQSTPADVAEKPYVTVSGTIICAEEGPWTLYAWRLAASAERGTDGLPLQQPALAIPQSGGGPWSLPLPTGPRRLIAAVHDVTGTVAWSDPHGRAFPLDADLEALSLICTERTPAPDGSEVIAQGARVVIQPVARVPTEDLANTAIGRARTSKIHRIARTGTVGGVATEHAIRERYERSIDDDTMNAMMPLLMQLADSPDEADKLVARTRKQLGSTGPAKGSSRRSSSAPVGMIEIHNGGSASGTIDLTGGGQ